MTKIKTNGNQLLSVPNNEEGQQFLYLLSKYANHKRFRIRKKGRGGGEGKTFWGDTKVTKAKWIAVYVDDKSFPEQARERYAQQSKREAKAREAGIKEGIEEGKRRVAQKLTHFATTV